jgi:uncharacterized membrane protein
LVGWWLLVLVVFFLVPVSSEGGAVTIADRVWAAAHGVCAQVDGHMLVVGGHVLPLCARDSGIYAGTLLGIIYLLVRGGWRAAGRPPRWFWWIAGLIALYFVADVTNSVADDWFFGAVYPPHNLLRLTSGLLLGMVTSVLLLWAINLSFAHRQAERSILPHWGDMLGLVLVEAVGGLALWSQWRPLFVPLVVLSFSGMVAMLLAACFLWFLTRTRGKDLVENGWDAVPALFWASVGTVLIIAVLSWLRYRLGL